MDWWRTKDVRWFWGGCAVVLMAASVLIWTGCNSEPAGRLGLAFSEVESVVIKDPGAGLPADSDQGHFRKGFLLCNGSWEGKEILIVQEGRVIRVWEDWRAPERWLKSDRVLTAEEEKKITGYLRDLERYLGKVYIDPKVCDGLVMWLYETADGRGNPVIQSSNARIDAFDGLFKVLEGEGVGPGMKGDKVDAGMMELKDRVMGWPQNTWAQDG